MKTVNFNDCSLYFLEKTFGLKQQIASSVLEHWINPLSPIVIPDEYMPMLQICVQNLSDNVTHWNEQDLSLHFIGPIFSLARFTTRYRFNLFAQRFLQNTINNVHLQGKVDELVASGYREPEIPFFAFNEYKKDQEYKGDAAGQALAAMLVGQSLNQDNLPLYGCYVVGRNWFFMVLEGKNYTVSHAFDATILENTCQILRILLQLKAYCMERTEVSKM